MSRSDHYCHFSHKYKGKMFMLAANESCLVEMVDREEDIEEISESLPLTIQNEWQTEISHHAFEGHICSNTINLEGFIKWQSINILVLRYMVYPQLYASWNCFNAETGGGWNKGDLSMLLWKNWRSWNHIEVMTVHWYFLGTLSIATIEKWVILFT